MAAVIQLKAREKSAVSRARDLVVKNDPDAAMQVLDKHLMTNPDDAQALVVAASILKKCKHLAVAYVLAQRAKDLAPERSEAWQQLALCAQALWRMGEAEEAYRNALAKADTTAKRAIYLHGLSSCLLDQGRFADAEGFSRESISLIDEPMCRHNLGLSLLAQRQWTEGWKNYSYSIGDESRKLVKYKNPPEPIWDGTPGLTVAVYGEQGIGDEICAASLLPEVIRDSKRVIIDCDHRLKRLFQRSFPEASVHGTRWCAGDWKQEAETVDASIAGFEVGRYYRNADTSFPGTPYLTPCPDRTAMWKALFAAKRKPVIGIAWTGGIWQNASIYRELKLDEWAPIFAAVDAHFVSLQYRDARDEIAGHPVTQYSYATLTQDYDDTAALVASCDLVIGMQTSVCHLAGALGVPVWTLIPKTSQWRYGEEYTDVPWYRSMKLYRQRDTWAPVVEQVAADLGAHQWR